ncbi:predicted protein, partial [Haematococcus lacustris]
GACNVKLPDSLLNSVVVLDAPNPAAPGGVTKVYLLAMSHVSKVSVDQVRQLVRCVRPEVLGLELCKDRLGLLVDGQEDSVARQLWHCRRIMVEGLPAGPEWPKEEHVKQLLRCQPGKPVSSADIEADVNTLLATGFEGSAQGGQGWGIETFRPTKNLVKLSNKMFLPPEYVEGLLAQ